MDSWRYLCLLVFAFCILKVSFPLRIDFNENVVGVIGENTTKLECAFIQEDVKETIISLFLFAKNITSNEFIKIAQFRPAIGSQLLQGVKYLLHRVVLSNISTSSPTAILNFQPLICIDENEYACQVVFFNVQGNLDEETKSSKLQVTVNPDMPSILPDNTEAMEGDNITISCFGDVGKPPGIFIWEKMIGGIVSDQYNVTTLTYALSDSCSYQGTSNLTIQLTDYDDNAVIRCSVNDLAGGILYDVTQPLNVSYKVRPPFIKRNPEPDQTGEYLQGPGTIKLNCTSRGNPEPSYTWYKDENMNETLSFNQTLNITEVTTNNSGVYRCIASNNVSGKQYTESTTVSIRIVLEKTGSRTTTMTITIQTQDAIRRACTEECHQEHEKDKNHSLKGIVFGIIAAVLLVALVGVVILCWNKNRKMRLKYESSYDHLRLGDAQEQRSRNQMYDGIFANTTTDVSQYENPESTTCTQIPSRRRTYYENHRTDDRYEYAYVNPADERIGEKNINLN